VSEIEGVVSVNASHTDSLTTIVYDTAKASIVLISDRINELGYTVVGEISKQ
jgi:copper chaperone CopZ